MNKKDLKEATAIAQELATMLMAMVREPQQNQNAAQLYFQCGELIANAQSLIASFAIGAPLAGCFDQARVAGVTFPGFESVRLYCEGLTPNAIPGIAVANAGVRLSLIEESYILAVTTFTSRQDIDQYLDLMNASFDAAELTAGDSLQSGAYEAIIALHGAVTADLANRARPLPRMVTYSVPTRTPALWLAQMLYTDPTRAEELVAENKIVNPAFCLASGMCLAE